MSDDDSAGGNLSTANTLRGRAGESRLKLWLLLGANRFAVLAVLALGVFAAFLLVSVSIQPSLQSEITSTDTVETIFSTMIGVVVTGTTLVVTISQIILSQENGPLGDQRERMSDAMDFQTYARELLGTTTPADPSRLLRRLVEEAIHRAATVEDAVSDGGDRELEEEVGEFVDSLRDNAETAADQLDGTEFGTFEVLSAAVNFDYSWTIYQVQRLREEFDASLGEGQRSALDDLETALAMFGAAREHVKTLYFQWALVDLSQYILYAAVPALVVAGCMLTFVGAESFPGTTLGIDDVTWVVSAAFTVTSIPFLLFTSYILRIAIVAKWTLAIGPLVLRES